MKHQKDQNEVQKKRTSIGLLLAIPGTFILGATCLITLALRLEKHSFNEEIWSLFACGFIGFAVMVLTSEMSRLRVFIHELKHAVVVGLTGGKLQSFEVGKEEGKVSYLLYDDKLQYAPLITLAPYFFPLLSLPALIACLSLESYYREILTIVLGSTLAIDLCTAWEELHPDQSDLKGFLGGFIVPGKFIAGANFMWVAFCLLWVQGGSRAYEHAAYLLWGFATEAALQLAGHLQS